MSSPSVRSVPVRAVALLVIVAFLVVATLTTVVSLGSYCLTTDASSALGRPAR